MDGLKGAARFLRNVNWRVVAMWILAAWPGYLLAMRTAECAVNVPFMDDWQFIPLMGKAVDGTLTFGDLFAPHDEHRLLLPRIIILLSVLFSHKPYEIQCMISVVVVAIASIALLRIVTKSLGFSIQGAVVWGLCNLAIFSPIQYHNWLWPMQFAYLLPFMFMTVAAAIWLSSLPRSWRLTLCVLCGLMASFSFHPWAPDMADDAAAALAT
jgi:hypothetical protein